MNYLTLKRNLYLRTACGLRDGRTRARFRQRLARACVPRGTYSGTVVLVLVRRVVVGEARRLERLAVEPVEGAGRLDPVQLGRCDAVGWRREARRQRAERHGYAWFDFLVPFCFPFPFSYCP